MTVMTMMKVMAVRTLLSVVLMWTSFGVFHRTETEATSPPAPPPPPPPEMCDLHVWYLDRVEEGVFSGDLTPVQLRIKARIESLIANTKDTNKSGHVSCSTLATFQNILSPAASQTSSKTGHEDSSSSSSSSSEKGSRGDNDSPEASSGTSSKSRTDKEDRNASRRQRDSDESKKDTLDTHGGKNEENVDGENSERSENNESDNDSTKKDQYARNEADGEENVEDKNTPSRSKKPDTDAAEDSDSTDEQHDTDADADNSDTHSDDDSDDNNEEQDEYDEIKIYAAVDDDDDEDEETSEDENDVKDDHHKDDKHDTTDEQEPFHDEAGLTDDSADDQDVIKQAMADQGESPTSTPSTDTTAEQSWDFTPALQCREESRTSTWLDHMFQPFVPPTNPSSISPSFNVFKRCATQTCVIGTRPKKRTRVSFIYCHYYHILSHLQRMRNKTEPQRIPVAYYIEQSCQLPHKCSWQCFYGMQKQQCVEHYHLQLNMSQASSTVDGSNQNGSHEDDGNRSDSHEVSDAAVKSDEMESDDKDSQEINEEEENTNNEQDKPPTYSPEESRETDANSNNDDNDDKTPKEIMNGSFDETELDDGLTDEEYSNEASGEEDSSDEKMENTHRETFDSGSKEEHESHKHPEAEKAQNINSDHHENQHGGNEGHKTFRLSEEELLRIEAMLQHKALEQETKIQSLEILIMRLQNQILNQKLNEQNGTSHLVHLENQILRIENELSKLNQSYVALQAENEMLKSRQNKYLALEHKSKEESKQISLPSNASEYFQLILVQQEKVTLLSELLKNQSSALHKLQSRSEQLEEQNQVLYQIVLNQTALISHVMHKLQELSEQTLKNQQETSHLKSVVDLQTASSSIINKLEHMLNEDSLKKGNPSAEAMSHQKSSEKSGSSSGHQDKNFSRILRFLKPEYSSKLQQQKCEDGENIRLCLYFSVIVSPCPPFRTLSWSSCQQMVSLIEPAKDVKMKRTTHEDSLNEQTVQKRTQPRVDEEKPDLVEIPSVRSASKEPETKSETHDQERANDTNTQPPAEMHPLPVTVEDGEDSGTTNTPPEDEGNRSETDNDEGKSTDSHQHKKPEADKKTDDQEQNAVKESKEKKEDTAKKTREQDTKNQDRAKTLSDSTGASNLKEKSSGTDRNTVDKVAGNEKQSSEPSNPPHSESSKKQQTDEKQDDGEQKDKPKTSSKKGGSEEEEGVSEEERKRKQEAEKALKLKQEAEAMQKKIQEADARRPAYWSSDNKKPKDCYDLYLRSPRGQARSGAYKVFVKGLNLYVSVLCDMKGGGWTVLLKREDGSLDFYRDWEDYKRGFGSSFGEQYLGNEVMHYLTNQDQYSLQVDLKDWQGNTRTATYRHFWLGDEEQYYQLHVLGYSGDAGDGLGKHDGMRFSTRDRDHDLLSQEQMGGSCARRFRGAGWYFRCYASNLMGQHYEGGSVPGKKFDGVAWKPWTGPSYSLKEVVLKVRPRGATGL
ncbi:uncharacterized protein LOC143296455 [Babylonia areolata]|uniref:uncharacterized protein LOC143296455 n=1 Tax=Babylonia areolata TaxID=304850 RepID=UPI003FD065E7